MTPPLDLDRLEELAKSATPGPWEMLYLFGSKELPTCIVHGDNTRTVLDWTDASTSSVDDVKFIGALNPTVALQLIAEIKRLREAPEGLARPCTRTDYSVADLDREVIFIARQALEGKPE